MKAKTNTMRLAADEKTLETDEMGYVKSEDKRTEAWRKDDKKV